jgi:hypothetical protein
MAVTVHYEDGGVCESMLVLTPAQVELGRLMSAATARSVPAP